jgi:hypothetical protein
VRETLGPRFQDNFLFKPAEGTRGGILIACSPDFSLSPLSVAPGDFSLSATVTDRSDGSQWSITGVYGPQEDADKYLFIQEIRELLPLVSEQWLLIGDFNLIKNAQDKSNNNLNLRLMGSFRAAIDDLELREFPLLGRLFTWCNERESSTHTRIDRCFMTKEWELKYPQYQLSLGSTRISDHCPLFIKRMQVNKFRGFRFEAYWLKMEGFYEVVQGAWDKPVNSQDASKVLLTKIGRTAKALKKWDRKRAQERRLKIDVANEVIFQLDVAQESRSLSAEETSFRKLLKDRLLGWAAIDRIKWRQRSRMIWIKEGDANSKLFHLRANGRRRKNHIPSLNGINGVVSEHNAKASIIFRPF